MPVYAIRRALNTFKWIPKAVLLPKPPPANWPPAGKLWLRKAPSQYRLRQILQQLMQRQQTRASRGVQQIERGPKQREHRCVRLLETDVNILLELLQLPANATFSAFGDGHELGVPLRASHETPGIFRGSAHLVTRTASGAQAMPPPAKALDSRSPHAPPVAVGGGGADGHR